MLLVNGTNGGSAGASFSKQRPAWKAENRCGAMLTTDNKAWTSHAEKIFSRFCFKVTHYIALKMRTSSCSPAPTKWEKDAQDFKCFFCFFFSLFLVFKGSLCIFELLISSLPCTRNNFRRKTLLWVREMFSNKINLQVTVQSAANSHPLHLRSVQHLLYLYSLRSLLSTFLTLTPTMWRF